MHEVNKAVAGASYCSHSLHKECCCPGSVDRTSTDVEPEQMACASETEGDDGDRRIKTHRLGGRQGHGRDTGQQKAFLRAWPCVSDI